MLYDAKGNPIKEEKREYRCNLLGEDFTYKVVPKDKTICPYADYRIKYFPFTVLHEGKPRKVLVYMDSAIEVGEDIPENLRDVFAVHEKAHAKGILHEQMFPLEIEAARKAGVLEDYIGFMSREDVFKSVRKEIPLKIYGLKEENIFNQLKKQYKVEGWMKIENPGMENEKLVDME